MEIFDQLGKFLGFIIILLGILNCFFGYKLFKFTILVIGFVFGAIIGGLVGSIAGDGGTAVLAALMFGLLGALLNWFFYRLAIFVIGFLLGSGLIGLLLLASGNDIGSAAGVAVVAGIVGGIVALFIDKLIIITGTSFIGAYGIVKGILLLSDNSRLTPDSVLLSTIGVILLSAVGIFVQYYSTKDQSIFSRNKFSDTTKTKSPQQEVREANPEEADFISFPYSLELANGRRISLTGIRRNGFYALTIGRESKSGIEAQAHIKLPDSEMSVSREQAALVYYGGSMKIINLSDTNNTIINNRKIFVNEEYEIKKGDIIIMGRITLKVVK